jgi:hypothetical protein
MTANFTREKMPDPNFDRATVASCGHGGPLETLWFCLLFIGDVLFYGGLVGLPLSYTFLGELLCHWALPAGFFIMVICMFTVPAPSLCARCTLEKEPCDAS